MAEHDREDDATRQRRDGAASLQQLGYGDGACPLMVIMEENGMKTRHERLWYDQPQFLPEECQIEGERALQHPGDERKVPEAAPA